MFTAFYWQGDPFIGNTLIGVESGDELGDIRRFKNPKQMNAYAGIDIQRHQSGQAPVPGSDY